MNSRRTRGLVLSVNDNGEADKIVTFLSPELGRASGIAKGAKRSKKRFVNKLEIFSLLEIHYRPSRNDSLLFIVEAELEDAFLPLRRNFRRYIVAMYVTELVTRFTREYDPDSSVFSLLLWALNTIKNDDNPLQACALFHLRLLGAVGYRPGLDRCSLCGRQVSADSSFTLHHGTGSLVCSQCGKQEGSNNVPLSIQTLKFLDYAQRIELRNIERLRLPERNTREALYFLYRNTRHLLQQDIASWQQLKNILGNCRE